MKFSIITIAYNAESQIESTIKSVLGLKYYDYEYILIDGKSTDHTLDIITKYQNEFKKKGVDYRYISEKDKGISDAFNKGIGMALGDYIGIINAGDKLFSDSLGEIEKNIQDSADIIYGNILWNDINRGYSYIRKSKKQINRLKYEMVIMHPSVFVARKIYEKYGLFREEFRYSMDQELLYRFFVHGCKFVYIDKELAEMSADGVSDKNPWPVLWEASRIPRLYSKWNVMTYFFLIIKYTKNRFAKIIRRIQYRR